MLDVTAQINKCNKMFIKCRKLSQGNSESEALSEKVAELKEFWE